VSNLDLLNKAFDEAFPASTPAATVQFVEANDRGGGKYGIVMRLLCWDVDPETGVQSIRDVKEQELELEVRGLDLATLGRIRELACALVNVLERVLDHPEIEDCTPQDLVDLSPLKLKASTEAEFVAALLTPTRLGRYLPARP
jgi:hypothetical protein